MFISTSSWNKVKRGHNTNWEGWGISMGMKSGVSQQGLANCDMNLKLQKQQSYPPFLIYPCYTLAVHFHLIDGLASNWHLWPMTPKYFIRSWSYLCLVYMFEIQRNTTNAYIKTWGEKICRFFNHKSFKMDR